MFTNFVHFFLDVFALVTSAEIRKLRNDQPENLATLIYKATERLVKAVDNSCRTAAEQQAVLNCVRLLTRIIPYIFEDSEWKDFFFEALPSTCEKDESTPLAHSLINAICVIFFIAQSKLPTHQNSNYRIFCSAPISQSPRRGHESQVPIRLKNCRTSTVVNIFGKPVSDSRIR